jgi:hypothetical protein
MATATPGTCHIAMQALTQESRGNGREPASKALHSRASSRGRSFRIVISMIYLLSFSRYYIKIVKDRPCLQGIL